MSERWLLNVGGEGRRFIFWKVATFVIVFKERRERNRGMRGRMLRELDPELFLLEIYTFFFSFSLFLFFFFMVELVVAAVVFGRT